MSKSVVWCYRLVSVGPWPELLDVSIREGLEVVGYSVADAGEAGNIGAGLGELSRDPE